jgi:hypothetical protein
MSAEESGPELTVTVTANEVRIEDETRQSRTAPIDPDPLHRQTIEIFASLLRHRDLKRREEFEVLGQHLYNMLFNADVEIFFHQTRQRVPEGKRLRVQLSFEESASDLAGLPWEYLWNPRRSAFFSTDSNLVLSRYLMPVEGGRENLAPGESPLRVLVMISEPDQLESVIAEPVREAIDKLKEVLPIEISWEDSPTPDDFVDILRNKDPHVLHFLGHGRFRKNPARAEIALLKDARDRSEFWCRDKDFAEYFVQAHVRPRLVFLHLCEGARVDFDASFAGLAPQLIRRAGVPAVVAMQYPIENRSAIRFSRAFYERISAGETVDAAVQYGRYKLTQTDEAYDDPVFGTPVLYMYSHNGIIRPAEAAAQNLRPGSATAGGARSASTMRVTASREAAPPTPRTAPPPASSAGNAGTLAATEDGGTRTNPTQAFAGGRAGAVDPGLRGVIKTARRKAREQLDSMFLDDSDARAAAIARINDMLDEIAADPDRFEDIIAPYWDAARSVERDIIEQIEDSVQQWQSRRPDATP